MRSVLLGLHLTGPSGTIYTAATREVNRLLDRGLVYITPNNDVSLTPQGRELMAKEFPDGTS